MNILRFELRSLLRSFLIWTTSLIGLYLLLMLGFYGMFMEGREAVMAALDQMPKYFALMFGVQMDKIFTFGGFFQFAFVYIGVVGAIMAATVALHVFAREKRLKCGDFILTKPVTRGKIFGMKLVACLTVLVVTNLLYISACFAAWHINGEDGSATALALASVSLFMTQFVFLGISTLVSILRKKVRSVSGVATAIGLTGFLVQMLSSLLKEEFVRYLSPLGYFSPSEVFVSGGYNAQLAWTGAAVAVATMALSYVLFARRDAHAV